jgi:hypothetical protein
VKSDNVKLYVTIVLVLQAASTVVLWFLNVLSVQSTATFEVLLAANLVAFAIIVQAYRNPDSIGGSSGRPAEAQQSGTTPTESHGEAGPAHAQRPMGAALSPLIHTAIPILSIVVLFAFAVVLFLPANEAAIPPTSTELYIPVYLIIVVTLVLGSMYLFKRLMDAETDSATH